MRITYETVLAFTIGYALVLVSAPVLVTIQTPIIDWPKTILYVAEFSLGVALIVGAVGFTLRRR